MVRAAALVAALVAASACASPDAPTDAGTTGAPGAASEALAVRTDSLLISVDSLQYTVAIGYPQISGATATVSAEAVARVNAAIRDSVAAFAAGVRPAGAVPPEGIGSPAYTVEVAGRPQAMRLHGDVLSGLVEAYAFTGGAHGNTVYLPVTYDLRTGAAIAMPDLFRDGTPWADSLSAHARRALVAALMENDPAATPESAATTFYPEGYDAAAMRSARFALGADSLTVQFAPYEVAYYAFGAPDVRIAYADLDAFLRPDGPAARVRR